MVVFPRISVQSAQWRLKLCQMGKITLPLLRPLVVTRLILRTHQAVGTAVTVGRQVQVAAAPPDRLLHMTAPCFRGLKIPTLAVGIRQEAAEFTAMRTRACDSARPCPIAWRFQRFGDPCAHSAQPVERDNSGHHCDLRLVDPSRNHDHFHAVLPRRVFAFPRGVLLHGFRRGVSYTVSARCARGRGRCCPTLARHRRRRRFRV